MAAGKTIKVEVKRQASPEAKAVVETFEIPYRPNMTHHVAAGRDCAESDDGERCGVDRRSRMTRTAWRKFAARARCLINGKAMMACSALVDKLEQPIRLAPLSKFPVVRDLAVDRSVLFENLKKVKAWVPIDGSYDLGAGPRQQPQIQEQRYPLVELHLLHHLHGGLSAVQRGDRLCGRGDDRAGKALQHGPRRQRAEGRPFCARWPAMAASRNAASRRTAYRHVRSSCR